MSGLINVRWTNECGLVFCLAGGFGMYLEIFSSLNMGADGAVGAVGVYARFSVDDRFFLPTISGEVHSVLFGTASIVDSAIIGPFPCGIDTLVDATI